MTKTQSTTSTNITTSHDDWFDQFVEAVVHNIRVDQLALKTNTETPETRKIYDSLMSGSPDDMYTISKEIATKHFIKNITFEYLTALLNGLILEFPTKLAMKITDTKILVWAEVKDDDEDTEDKLILSEAKINSKYYNLGFHISSTIVEESDNMDIPTNYKKILPLEA